MSNDDNNNNNDIINKDNDNNNYIDDNDNEKNDFEFNLSQETIDSIKYAQANTEYISKILKTFTESNYNNFLQISERLKEVSTTISNAGTIAIQNSVDLTQITKPISDILSNSSSSFIDKVSETIKPLSIYIEENRDKLENYNNSFDKILNQYIKIYSMNEDEASDLIEKHVDEGKIIINDDWVFEVVDIPVSEIDIEKQKKRIKKIVSIIITTIDLITNVPSIEIDNSETHIHNDNSENHYHIEKNEIEYIVTNDTKLHLKPDEDSEVRADLFADDILQLTLTDDGWLLVTIVNDDHEIINSGWVKSEDALPKINNE